MITPTRNRPGKVSIDAGSVAIGAYDVGSSSSAPYNELVSDLMAVSESSVASESIGFGSLSSKLAIAKMPTTGVMRNPCNRGDE